VRNRHLHQAASVAFSLALLLGAAGTPVGAADAIDAAALAAELQASKNPAKAYRALTPDEQSAVDEYLSVTTIHEETSSTPIASASRGPRVDGVVTLAASTCWSLTKTLTARNFYGQTMWQYHQRVDWCGNGSTITDVLRRSRWATVYHLYWAWNHIENATGGGVGRSYYWAFTQAEFRYCPPTPLTGCYNYRYPYIDMTMRPNGVVDGSMGG
jgi:hypothetical protein